MSKIYIGGIYKHFKGIEIQVITEGTAEATKEDIVVYRRLDNGDVWSRTREDFLSDVDKNKYPDASQDTRFVFTGIIKPIEIEISSL